MTLNKLMLAGNLTRDPEVRFTPKGMPIAKFGLAINRKWKDATTGESKEDVTFVDVDAFGKTAEIIGQNFKKGSQIFIEGRLKLDTWDVWNRENRPRIDKAPIQKKLLWQAD